MRYKINPVLGWDEKHVDKSNIVKAKEVRKDEKAAKKNDGVDDDYGLYDHGAVLAGTGYRG